jgi:hypothetical protein
VTCYQTSVKVARTGENGFQLTRMYKKGGEAARRRHTQPAMGTAGRMFLRGARSAVSCLRALAPVSCLPVAKRAVRYECVRQTTPASRVCARAIVFSAAVTAAATGTAHCANDADDKFIPSLINDEESDDEEEEDDIDVMHAEAMRGEAARAATHALANRDTDAPNTPAQDIFPEDAWWENTTRTLEPGEDDAGDDRVKRYKDAAVAVKNMVNDTDRVPSAAANRAYAAKYWVSNPRTRRLFASPSTFYFLHALLDFTRAVRACHTQAWAEMNDMTDVEACDRNTVVIFFAEEGRESLPCTPYIHLTIPWTPSHCEVYLLTLLTM